MTTGEPCQGCNDPDNTYRKWRRRAEHLDIQDEYEHHIDTGQVPSAAYWAAHDHVYPKGTT